ncbi:MAG: isochorismatase family protein [Oligoflexia bacterium]|nr:isochorismatase family protein [Oligoflexia bacterium]
MKYIISVIHFITLFCFYLVFLFQFQLVISNIFASEEDTALLVIDMQLFYLENQDSEIVNNLKSKIIEQIKSAKKNKQKIIFVEYRDDDGFVCESNVTISELLNEVKGYKKYKQILKSGENGSREIIQVLKGTNVKTLNVCGINTSCCVKRTVEGLLKSFNQLKKINIHAEACADFVPDDSDGHNQTLKYFKSLDKKIQVIPVIDK